MRYPDRQTYRKLYARYVSENGRSVNELLDLAGDLADKTVIDLCGGGGELSLAAVQRGAASVTWVDKCVRMADTEALYAAGVAVHCMDAGIWLFIPKRIGNLADAIFCRQAVNYWFHSDSGEAVADNLKKDGVFVFNTFNRKPPAKPTVKEYVLNGLKYVEVSWMGPDNIVRHVQSCEGMEPHVTQFDWIAPAKFREWLRPWFEVKETRSGGTSLYRCVKK